jgi:hypothetical protein
MVAKNTMDQLRHGLCSNGRITAATVTEREKYLALDGEVSGVYDAVILRANYDVSILAAIVERQRARGPSSQLLVVGGSCKSACNVCC